MKGFNKLRYKLANIFSDLVFVREIKFDETIEVETINYMIESYRNLGYVTERVFNKKGETIGVRLFKSKTFKL